MPPPEKKSNPKVTKDKSNYSHIINSREIHEKGTQYLAVSKKIQSSDSANTDAYPKYTENQILFLLFC